LDKLKDHNVTGNEGAKRTRKEKKRKEKKRKEKKRE
jgi:hypothetical protein